jgi:hypothetical protein
MAKIKVKKGKYDLLDKFQACVSDYLHKWCHQHQMMRYGRCWKGYWWNNRKAR